MTSMVLRQNKTADGLRNSLFDCLDAVINKKISSKEVECVCAISEQIINSAKFELQIELEKERIVKEKRDFEKQERIEIAESTKQLAYIANSIDATIMET